MCPSVSPLRVHLSDLPRVRRFYSSTIFFFRFLLRAKGLVTGKKSLYSSSPFHFFFLCSFSPLPTHCFCALHVALYLSHLKCAISLVNGNVNIRFNKILVHNFTWNAGLNLAVWTRLVLPLLEVGMGMVAVKLFCVGWRGDGSVLTDSRGSNPPLSMLRMLQFQSACSWDRERLRSCSVSFFKYFLQLNNTPFHCLKVVSQKRQPNEQYWIKYQMLYDLF